MYASAEIDVTVTVNELMSQYPATVAVFNRFGMDTCCGSSVAVTDAARRDGVDLEELRQALAAAVAGQ